jgi:hypothetical protein
LKDWNSSTEVFGLIINNLETTGSATCQPVANFIKLFSV